MNICIFSHGHISKTRGGVDRVTDTLSTELAYRGHCIYMISAAAPVENDIIKENQFVLPNKNICSDENRRFAQNFLEEKKVDIILNQADIKSIFDLIFDVHGEIPIISTIHTDPQALIKAVIDNWDEWKIKDGWKFWLKYPYFFLRRIYQHHNRKKYTSLKLRDYYEKCDAIVLLSERFKKSFIKISGIDDTSKLYAINNPISFNEQQNAYTKKEKLVLFVGRLCFQKRIDRLLEIWGHVHKYHEDWKLRIIGDGPEKMFYKNYAKKIKLTNVEFIGACNPEEHYKKATILCLTSSFEGLPCVVQEALQYNVIPIVYKSFESIEDIIINGKNGFTIKPFSSKEFGHILRKLMSDDKYRCEIQDNITNHDLKEKFSAKIITDKWEALFERLI